MSLAIVTNLFETCKQHHLISLILYTLYLIWCKRNPDFLYLLPLRHYVKLMMCISRISAWRIARTHTHARTHTMYRPMPHRTRSRVPLFIQTEFWSSIISEMQTYKIILLSSKKIKIQEAPENITSPCKFGYMAGEVRRSLFLLQGLYSLSRKTSYRKISWSLDVARFGLKLFQSLWNLAGTSVALLPRCLSNFRAIRPLQHPISRLRDFTRFGGKTSYRLVNRGPDPLQWKPRVVMVTDFVFTCGAGGCRYDNLRCTLVTMMTSSNGNLFRVTGLLWGESISHRWIPHTKASDAELWCFLWSVP